MDAALKILNFAIYHKELTEMDEREEEREKEREREQERKRKADTENNGPDRGSKSKRE